MCQSRYHMRAEGGLRLSPEEVTEANEGGRQLVGRASRLPKVAVVEQERLGLTNPQISERLLMSRDTVKTHLSHIFTKLGVVNA